MKKIMVIISVLLLLTMYTAIPGKGAMTSGIFVKGPTVVATNTTAHYKVTLSSIFDVYRCTLIVAGENLTGASPTDQVSKVSYVGEFDFEVKTPKEPQRIYLDFKVFGTLNSTGKTKIFEKKLAVDVKEPFVIHGSVKNIENYTLRNVTVYFYVDSNPVGNITLDKIDPNSTKTFTYNWIPNVNGGEHVLVMKVMNDGVIFNNGKNVYSMEIYIGTVPSYDWIMYSAVTVLVIVSTLYFIVFLGKRKKRTGPKWKK